MVHMSQFELILKIGYGPEPPHNRRRATLPGKFDRQAGKCFDLDCRTIAECCSGQRHALVGREKRSRFVRSLIDRDNHPVENPSSAGRHIDMTVGDGVEAAWINRGAHAPPIASRSTTKIEKQLSPWQRRRTSRNSGNSGPTNFGQCPRTIVDPDSTKVDRAIRSSVCGMSGSA